MRPVSAAYQRQSLITPSGPCSSSSRQRCPAQHRGRVDQHDLPDDQVARPAGSRPGCLPAAPQPGPARPGEVRAQLADAGADILQDQPDQDFTLPGLARFVADCCDALELTDFNMVANDTGGAVAQVFAAGHPERLRTLTLTNCEAHDNVPPKALLPAVLLARMGLHARLAPRLMAHDNPRTRKRVYGRTYQDIANLPEEIARVWLEAQTGTPDAARQGQRLLTSLHARDLLAAEPALRRLQVPTLIVWGTGDIFFRRKWAYWLRDAIPGATEDGRDRGRAPVLPR